MDYDWIEMMNYMQNLRQFCSRNVRHLMNYAVVWDLANLQSAV